MKAQASSYRLLAARLAAFLGGDEQTGSEVVSWMLGNGFLARRPQYQSDEIGLNEASVLLVAIALRDSGFKIARAVGCACRMSYEDGRDGNGLLDNVAAAPLLAPKVLVFSGKFSISLTLPEGTGRFLIGEINS